MKRVLILRACAIAIVAGFLCILQARPQSVAFPGPGLSYGCTASSVNATSLMHLDGSNGATSTTDVYGHTITSTNAQLSTSQARFGPSSMTNTATTAGNGFTVGNLSTDFQYLTGAFTIDFWYFYSATDNTNNASLLSNGSDGGGVRWRLGSTTTNRISYYYNSATTTGTTTLSSGGTYSGWWHLAAAKDGSNNMRFFVNGSSDSTVTTAAVTVTSTTGLQIGGENAGTSMPSIAGFVDEVRTIKGAAYWTSSFTPNSLPWCN